LLFKPWTDIGVRDLNLSLGTKGLLWRHTETGSYI